jgi:hypothetical protein
MKIGMNVQLESRNFEVLILGVVGHSCGAVGLPAIDRGCNLWGGERPVRTAVEILGSASVVASDKTETLTRCFRTSVVDG